jgi:UDP-N-acetylmuramoylalanine--D-glutamate ligase
LSKRIVILGSGESGTGAAILAMQKGYSVFVSDMGLIAPAYKKELDAANVPYEEGKHTASLILNADEIIKSPGIAPTVSIVAQAIDKGIPVISEIEFAARFTNAKLICITGTNGKTTTTSLVYHMLKTAQFNVAMGGNIGTSFARLVASSVSYDYYVLEVSSFQLDDMYKVRAHVAVILNITPDHLDRYGAMQNYIASKYRITQNQQASDYFIYCQDDESTVRNTHLNKGRANTLTFSHNNIPNAGAWVTDGMLMCNINQQETNNHFIMYINDLSIRGQHNGYNSMAAAIIGQVLNIRKETIRESLMSFQHVEHRLEHVLNIGGVEFINDSKATNVNAAWYALESMEKSTIWVAGGVDKGNDYNMLKPLVKEKVRIIVCLGIDNRKIHEAFASDVDMIINTTSAREAVHVAQKLARPGEAVLLSPACASFDLFKNYEDRGRQFKQAVKEL